MPARLPQDCARVRTAGLSSALTRPVPLRCLVDVRVCCVVAGGSGYTSAVCRLRVWVVHRVSDTSVVERSEGTCEGVASTGS